MFTIENTILEEQNEDGAQSPVTAGVKSNDPVAAYFTTNLDHSQSHAVITENKRIQPKKNIINLEFTKMKVKKDNNKSIKNLIRIAS